MSITSSITNRITGKAQSEAAKVINKLANKGGQNISTLTFPHNLQNQAQSTYMVIYVLDNESNKESFSTTVFDSNVETTSYEIKAVSFLKDYAKQELERLKNNLKEAGNYLVNSAKDTFTTYVKAKADSVASVEMTATAKKLKEIGEWTNEWLVPHKVTKGGNALKNQLDPTKNVGKGWVLKQAFAIQMPNSSLRYTYENGWESTDTSTLATIKALISGVTGLFDKDERSKAKQKLSGVAEKIEQAIGDLVTGGGYSAQEKESKRIVANPVLAFNYTVPKPREFSYSFSLYPRNKEELYTLFNMIQMLKFYSLPESGAVEGKSEELWFNYPAKFAIKFYTNGYENEWFPKMMSLGLTRIEETLTGENGDMAFFENYFDKESGNPPRMVQLTLSFKELGILNRKFANAGY